MKNIDWQLSNLELSKKLKELGVKQESYFYWARDSGDWELKHKSELQSIINDGWTWLEEALAKGEAISAFTVAELGEMLPDGLETYYTSKALGDWRGYKRDDEDEMTTMFLDINEKTEANARAKMLIYLLENKLIEKS